MNGPQASLRDYRLMHEYQQKSMPHTCTSLWAYLLVPKDHMDDIWQLTSLRDYLLMAEGINRNQ